MKEIIESILGDVHAMMELLISSVERVQIFDIEQARSAEEWEPYDALCTRFERVVDIIGNQLFTSLELYFYGDKSRNMRDRFLRMEKEGYIDSAEQWFDMKMLRNKIAHAYLPEQVSGIYKEIVEYAPILQETFRRISDRFAK